MSVFPNRIPKLKKKLYYRINLFSFNNAFE